MTYDPYSNPTDPRDPYYHRAKTAGSGAGLLLVMTLLVLGGFIYYFSMGDKTTVASNDIRPPITQPQTTGSVPSGEGDTAIPLPPQRPAR